MQKLLTIIVPSYNMEAYLAQNLDSLLIGGEAQAYLDVIVVNDGSTDRTAEIAQTYVRRFPDSVRLLSKPNGHYGSCVNAGLAVARGTYVRILDGDDSMDKAAFARYVQWLAEEQTRGGSVDLVVSDWVKVDPDGVPFETRHYGFPKGRCTIFDLGRTELFAGGVAYRTALLREMNYRQTEGCAYTDVEWVNFPLAFVQTVLYFPSPVLRYLIGRKGQSVEVDTYLRGMPTVLELILGCMRFYKQVREVLPPERVELFRERIGWRIVGGYALCLLGIQGRIPNCDLRPFDRAVRDFGEGMEAFTDSQWVPYSLFGARRKLRYIRLWRKRQTRKTFTFWLYDYFGRPRG